MVKGKDALRRYWTMGLEKTPGLRFQVTAVYEGVNTLVIASKMSGKRTARKSSRFGMVL
jgi:hypothetical protein